MPTLSVVMIVKDEEDKLETSLIAASKLANEIVVVDTGSTDATVSIAEKYTSNIYSFSWIDDFSAARNHAISHATCDWCLTVDADDVIQDPEQSRILLDKFMASHSPETMGTVEIRSELNSGDDVSAAKYHAARFFHRTSFHYVGIVHEQLITSGSADTYRESTDVIFSHSGYMHDSDDKNHKANRNIPLLNKALEEKPLDEYYLYQLGQAHFTLNAFESAIESFEKSASIINFDSQNPSAGQGPVSREVLTGLITSLCYSYINTNQLDKASDLMAYHASKAHIGINSADFAHALGYLNFMLGKIPESIEAYELSMQLGPEMEDVAGTGSFSSIYHLGLLYETSNEPIKALEHYVAALQACPGYDKAIDRCLGFISDYKTLLPEDIFKLSPPSNWSPIIEDKVRAALSAGDDECLELLLETSEMIAPDVKLACTRIAGRN